MKDCDSLKIWTLNQEPPQGGPPCDAGTTSNPTSEHTNLREFVAPPEATSAPHALNQQKTESSVFNGDRANRATSQSSLETEPQLGTFSNQSISMQHQLAYRQSSG